MREQLADELINRHEEAKRHSAKKKRCFIGFDGVTDEIISAIAQKKNGRDIPFKKIADFGQRIVDASGKSCNIELSVRTIKIGGNAPILTEALLKGSHLITFAGTIGEKDRIEPLFQEMAAGCEEVFPLGPSAHSDAIEFEDGKVIFGKLSSFEGIDYAHLLNITGLQKLKEIFERSDLFVSANWTMIFNTNQLWENILQEVFPLTPKKRFLFVDLADPAKRTDEDLGQALHLLKKFSPTYQVILGLNEAEAMRIAKVLALPEFEDLQQAAKAIQEKTSLTHIVIHATRFACAASAGKTWLVNGPYTNEPFMTTGAGDNFNAGFCNALLYELSIEKALLSGVATSGFYVRTGKSPTMEELASFLKKWK